MGRVALLVAALFVLALSSGSAVASTGPLRDLTVGEQHILDDADNVLVLQCITERGFRYSRTAPIPLRGRGRFPLSSMSPNGCAERLWVANNETP